VLSVLNIWNSDHFDFKDDGFPLPVVTPGRRFKRFTQVTRDSVPKEITCNAGRVIDVEAKSYLPKKCYGAYYDIDDALSNYRKDFCVLEFQLRRDLLELGRPHIRSLWEEDGAWDYNSRQWDADCNRPTFDFACGKTRMCDTWGRVSCEDGGARGCAYEGYRDRYIRDCGVTDASYPERDAEWKKKVAFLDAHYADEGNLITQCGARYQNCRGSTECNLVGCEVDYFLWACTDPRTEYPAATITYHYADTINVRSDLVQCALPRKVMILKAEFGAGFDIQDSADAVEASCSERNGLTHQCEINATMVASALSPPVSAEGKTVRTETLCACPAGYEIIPDASDDCIPCLWGEYRTETMSTCELVPRGYFSSEQEDQREAAYPCPAGAFSELLGALRCEQCSVGYWSDATAAPTSETCMKCDPGTVSPTPGRRVACEQCDPGYEPNEQQTSCIPCQPGFASPGNGQYCRACVPGTFANSTKQTMCNDALPGFFQPNSGGTEIILAPKGFYVEVSRAVAPEPCEYGYTTALAATTSSSECVAAPQPPPPCPEDIIWKVSPTDAENCAKLVALLNVTLLEVGNGFCQRCLNVPECNWDGGDCCPETCEKIILPLESEGVSDDTLSFSCDPRRMNCLSFPRDLSDWTCNSAPEFSDASDEALDCDANDGRIGNGKCDRDLNAAACGYDGGDCCLYTCEASYPGLCAPDTMDCVDPNGLIDLENPVLHGLPPAEINLTCSVLDMPDVAKVTSTDNDLCFEAVVSYEEWTDIEPPTCADRTIWRKFKTSDPQGNTAEFTQTFLLKADVEAPQWDVFPEDKELIFSDSDDEGSVSPDVTGRPTFVDACQKDVVLKYEDAISIDILNPGKKRIDRYWTVTDACDNSNLRRQTIHILTLPESVITPSCIEPNRSCSTGYGLRCCDGFACVTNFFKFPFESTCQPCTGEDEVCSPMPGSVSSCCGGLHCLSRFIPGVGSQSRCIACLPMGDMSCQVDEDCCDSLLCRDVGSGVKTCSF
jgi:hypothetical protein